MRKIYRKEMIVPIILFSIFSTLSYASTRVLNENFDNQAIIQPTIGSITVNQYGRSNLTPPEYNLTQVGVGGTGYTFSSGTIWEAYLQWNYGRAWYSDEIYVSYWLRYPRYVAPSHDVNAKIFYPHWDGLTSYVHYSMFDDHTLYYSAVSKGSTLSAGNYINCPGNTDGNWHHYEFWIKLSTAQSRFWYDGTLKIDHNYSDGVWGNNIDYLTFGSIDGNDIDDFSRQFDSIEVWDGMPGSSLPSDTTPPTGSVLINAGASSTTSNTVTLNLSASDTGGSVTGMKISNDGITYSSEVSYSSSYQWAMLSGNGIKTVYVIFKDNSGNWMTTPVSDSIQLIVDTIPPSAPGGVGITIVP